MKGYFALLEERSRAIGSLVCVSLDPDPKRTPLDSVVAYNSLIIEATAPFAACFKPNIAFYEQWGAPGLRALEQTRRAIPAGIPVIGDVKRGDIGSTAEAYARAMFEAWDFDAITLNPYLGRDSIEPFLAYEGRGIYVVCRTSNPGAAEFQDATVNAERPLYEHVAATVTAWSPNIGLVVGATAPAELRRVRELVPRVSLLVPGVGAQGGRPMDVIAAAGGEPGTIVVNASRSIYYAAPAAELDAGTALAAALAAKNLRDELAAARATA